MYGILWKAGKAHPCHRFAGCGSVVCYSPRLHSIRRGWALWHYHNYESTTRRFGTILAILASRVTTTVHASPDPEGPWLLIVHTSTAVS